ncbi:MAG: TetR/AcrR family transcriptional regulator [Candidatus Limnocylindrales bacterium]
MADVKPVRRPTLRAERAAVTRGRIAEAARLLFLRDGYGATTIAAIAVEAGVAVQTVYAVYGSKLGIFRELRDSIANQPEADALVGLALAAPDSAAKLNLFAASIRARWEAGHDVVTIGAQAAAVDPAIRAEIELVLARRRAGIAGFAGSLEGGLAAAIDVRRAAALIDALTTPELYEILTRTHSWSPADYEAWLAESLRRQLLPG